MPGLRTALFNYLWAKVQCIPAFIVSKRMYIRFSLCAHDQRMGGDFILRIEDTDQVTYIHTKPITHSQHTSQHTTTHTQTRLVPGSQDSLVEILEWAQLPFDEGPPRTGRRARTHNTHTTHTHTYTHAHTRMHTHTVAGDTFMFLVGKEQVVVSWSIGQWHTCPITPLSMRWSQC